MERSRLAVNDVIHRPVDRRVFLNWASRIGVAGFGLLGAWGTAGRAAAEVTRAIGGASVSGNLPKTLKLGVIVPTSGIGQFLGEIAQRSLIASLQHIEDENLMKGTKVSYQIVDAPAERFAQGTSDAYNKLVADPDVVGILWCTPIGIAEAKPQIQRDQIPVIAVYADLWSDNALYPRTPERSIFQMLLPDVMSFDALSRYAKRDRGYKSAGLIYDSSLLADAKGMFANATKKAGLQVAGIEEFQIFSGDYGAQLQRLKQARPEALFVWGLSDNTSGIVKGLAALNADFVDTPTAKAQDSWRPHILGYPGGTGEKKWAELAGDAAKTGSVTAWYLGGLVGGPQFAIRDWLKKAGQQAPSGGEETISNAFWALLESVRKAGSTDRRKMVTELERLETRFAGLDYSFAPKRHLSLTPDQVTLITLERYNGPITTDPPYDLGREWSTTFAEIRPDYVGPVHLVRPTLAANKRAQPDYMQQVLREGWGIQCTKTPPDAPGASAHMTNQCKIH